MRKTLITLFTTLMTLTTNAQGIISFTPFLSENNPCKWVGDGITLNVVDTKNKISADASIRRFSDGKRFIARLKTGGKSDSATNNLTVTLDKPGTLTIYASSASGQVARTLTLLQDGKTIATATLDNRNKSPLKTDVAAGDVTICYYDGAMSIYALAFDPKH